MAKHLDPDPGPRLDSGDDRGCIGRPAKRIRGNEGDRSSAEGSGRCGVSLECLHEASAGLEAQVAALVDHGAQAEGHRFVDEGRQPVAVDLGHDEVNGVGTDVDGGADRHPAPG